MPSQPCSAHARCFCLPCYRAAQVVDAADHPSLAMPHAPVDDHRSLSADQLLHRRQMLAHLRVLERVAQAEPGRLVPWRPRRVPPALLDAV